MPINWSATAAYTALIAAILSPIITAIINNRHQIKMSNRELYTKRKLDIFENYLRTASESSFLQGVDKEFLKYKALIFLYAPNNIHKKITELNKLAASTQYSDDATMLLLEIAIELRKEAKVR